MQIRLWNVGVLCLSAAFMSACSGTSASAADPLGEETLAVPTPEAAKAEAAESITEANFDEEFARLQQEIENDGG